MDRRDFLTLTGAGALAGGAWLADPRSSALRQKFDEPDVIVIGAGSSGCVVVHRLSENPDLRVLLVEAGESGEGDPAITTPGRWVSLIGSQYDWGYVTEPEAGLAGRRIPFPRGKVHGGSSAINAMTHIRGHRHCFDRWQELGNPGWGYSDVLPLFRRSERHDGGSSLHRGADGPLAVSRCTDPHAAHEAFLAAAEEGGFKADSQYDFNGPAPEGVAGFYQKNILNGRRHSAAAAFLVPALARPNVEVLSSAHVTRLLIDDRRAVGVEYLRGNRLHSVRAGREIILCAGAVDSPRLLMLSGIGPADHLRQHGIAPIVDVPGVGQNLQDHLKLSVRWRARSPLPGSTVTAGLFTSARSSSSPPDLQFYVGRGLELPDPFMTITVSLVRPASRGEIRLRSGDARDRPIILTRYLQARADVDAIVAGARMARSFGMAAAYDRLRGEETEPGTRTSSTAALERFARQAADTIYHAAGTCRMGPGTDATAVVDAELRVRGIQGLRVADASIMPDVVNATTHAACVAIGEKCADLVNTRNGGQEPTR